MEHNNLIKYILGISNNYNCKEFKYNVELIKNLLYNMIEDMTFCKIYNKDKVYEEMKPILEHNHHVLMSLTHKNFLRIFDHA
jgi:hypothetical protein